MGAQETLRIIVDAGQLDQIRSRVRNASTQTNTLNRQINDARRSARAAGIKLDDLPTLNRDLRIIGNTLNIPGFRQASAALFQARRGVRGVQLGREAQAIAGLDPELAKQLEAAGILTQSAIILIVAKLVIDAIEKFKKEEETRRAEFEIFVIDNLNITRQEFRALSREQIGFASFLDQFEENFEETGFFATLKEAIEDAVQVGVEDPSDVGKYVHPWREPDI